MSWKRLAARSRRTAKKCAGGAVYGMSVAWTGAYFLVYTPFALFAAGVMMVATAVVAAACLVVGGE